MKNKNAIVISKSGDKKLSFGKAGKYVVLLDNASGVFTFDIETAGVKLDIFGVYIGKNIEKYQVHTIQHHKAPNTWSNLLIKGVFEGLSQFAYRGLVRIDPDCNGSHAYQKNQNLLLSRNAKVSSEPDLEILSPDVFCTHGSTTGGIPSDQIYYMQSRGLVEHEAVDMYKNGFLGDVLEKYKRSTMISEQVGVLIV